MTGRENPETANRINDAARRLARVTLGRAKEAKRSKRYVRNSIALDPDTRRSRTTS
jgi:hypothetical protein